MARGVTVMVAFDYRAGVSILVPPAWREKISTFEGFPPG
jgi:acyl-CoA thioesterase FadM